MATYSPNAVREQSLQNLSEMSRLVDKLYERAKTPAARQSLTEISKALSSIRPSGIVPPQTLEVENLLREVLREYNQQFDEQKTDDIDEATMKVIREIVATRQKMCDCTMDMDEKRGFKSYYKAHKGEASKKEIKQAYKERYANAKSEADRYVIKANKLRQSVGSYKNTMGGFEREKLTKEVEAKIAETNAELRQLQVQYRQTTDRAVRARLNRRAGVLAKKEKRIGRRSHPYTTCRRPGRFDRSGRYQRQSRYATRTDESVYGGTASANARAGENRRKKRKESRPTIHGRSRRNGFGMERTDRLSRRRQRRRARQHAI